MPNRWLFTDMRIDCETDPLAECRARPDIQVLDRSELDTHLGDTHFAPEDKVIITAETLLEPILPRLDPERRSRVEVLRDKPSWRAALSPLYPDLDYRQLPTAELDAFEPPSQGRYIVKPTRGYASAGVRLIDDTVDLATLQAEIAAELDAWSTLLGDGVYETDTVLVESLIEGDPVTVDAYYDDAGDPQILCIYRHPAKPEEGLHTQNCWYLAAESLEALHPRVAETCRRLGEVLQVRNLPIHLEFIDDGQRLVPIDLNPMRFFSVGAHSLPYHALGLNPITTFLDASRPDWPTLRRRLTNRVWGWFLIPREDARGNPPAEGRLTALRERFGSTLRKLMPFAQPGHPADASCILELNFVKELTGIVSSSVAHGEDLVHER